ncbi:MAG: DUF2225 domain-containing protein [candidate division FCPU426 bacterium]
MSTPLWNKKLKCPFCGGEFETTRLRSSAVRVKEKQSDFGCVFEAENPYFYAITACPHCSVAARNEEFEKINASYEPKLIEVSKKLRQMKDKPDVFQTGELSPEQAIRRHELAIAMHKYRGHAEAGELAGLWMHVAWIRRLQGDAEKERSALAAAEAAYLEFFEKGSKFPERLGEPGILYMIGEIQRRTGRLREARASFSRALYSKELASYPTVEGLLREGMLIAKEETDKA